MKVKEPVLIDEIISKSNLFGGEKVLINDKWYIAKPLPYYGWKNTILRVYHAWLVLVGKASAWQYAEDRKDRKSLH